MQPLEQNPVYDYLVNNDKPLLPWRIPEGVKLAGLVIGFLFVALTAGIGFFVLIGLGALFVFTIGPAIAGFRNAQAVAQLTGDQAFDLVRITSLSDHDFRRGVTFAGLRRIKAHLTVAFGLTIPAALLYTALPTTGHQIYVIDPATGASVLRQYAGCILYGPRLDFFYALFLSLYFGCLSHWFALNLGAVAALKFRTGFFRSGTVLGVCFVLSVFLLFILLFASPIGEPRVCRDSLLPDILRLVFRLGVGGVVAIASLILRANIRLTSQPRI